MHTPLFWGEPLKAGAVVFLFKAIRPFLINWLIVGMYTSHTPFVEFIILLYLSPFFKTLAKTFQNYQFYPPMSSSFWLGLPNAFSLVAPSYHRYNGAQFPFSKGVGCHEG